MLLYKFTPSLEIAEQISVGVFRFYELTKYIKIEDEVGRSDTAECSVSFTEEECEAFLEKLPTGSYNGVEFKCNGIRPNDEYIRQYFAFCMSTEMNDHAIRDSKYLVELHADIFETFMMILCSSENESLNTDGARFFSHGPVEYYDIHNHPEPFIGDRWREVYVKHSDFNYQHEYRAALFASNHFFDRIREKPMVIERRIFGFKGEKMDFNLKISLRSGLDDDGWRYVEFDVSEFSANLNSEPSKITVLVGD